MNQQVNYQLPVNVEFTAEEVIKLQAILSDFQKQKRLLSNPYWNTYIQFAENMISKFDEAQKDAISHRLYVEYTENYKEQ